MYQRLRTQGGSIPVQHRLLAAIEVVEFLLGHRIVYVNGRNAQFTSL